AVHRDDRLAVDESRERPDLPRVAARARAQDGLAGDRRIDRVRAVARQDRARLAVALGLGAGVRGRELAQVLRRAAPEPLAVEPPQLAADERDLAGHRQ